MRGENPVRLADVHLQDSAVTALGNALRFNRLQQTYLLTGAPSIGKASLARAMTAALQCFSPADSGMGFPDACGQCDSCQRIVMGSHPDVSWLFPRGQEIRIDQVRAMQDSALLNPIMGHWRVFIIDPADRLNEFSANSLLKILEEAPTRVVFFLLARSNEGVLPTILSRASRVALQSPPHHQAREALAQLSGVNLEAASQALALSRGRFGLALHRLTRNTNEFPPVPVGLPEAQVDYLTEILQWPMRFVPVFEGASLPEVIFQQAQSLMESPPAALDQAEREFLLRLSGVPALPAAFPVLFTRLFLEVLEGCRKELQKLGERFLANQKSALPSAMFRELGEQFNQLADEFVQRRITSFLEVLLLIAADGFHAGNHTEERMLLNIDRKDSIMALTQVPGLPVLEHRIRRLEKAFAQHRRYVQTALILETILTEFGGLVA